MLLFWEVLKPYSVTVVIHFWQINVHVFAHLGTIGESCQVTFKNNGQFQNPPLPKKKKKGAFFGGGLTFWIFSLVFCSGVTKIFLADILGDWDIFVIFFDVLSVSHQNKGGVEKKKQQKMPIFRKNRP